MALQANDPKLTAYVLGELNEAERGAVEAELARSPELRTTVEEIRALAGDLEAALKAEPAPALDAARRQRVLSAGQKVRRPLLRSWKLWITLAAAACVAIAALVVFKAMGSHTSVEREAAQKAAALPAGGTIDSKEQEKMASTPASANTSRPILSRAGEATVGVTSLGLPSLEDRVGRVPLIVRARPIGWDEGIVEFAISYVIYGDCQETSVKVDLSAETGFARDEAHKRLAAEGAKEPAEPEFTEQALAEHGIVKGKELILFLLPVSRHPAAERGVKFLSLGMAFDAPTRFRLDDHEKEIVQAIASGKYLEPNPQSADILAERMRQATLIVRAKLTEVGDNAATWQIVRTIQGQDSGERVFVDFDVFRLRAEAIVNRELRIEGSGGEQDGPLTHQEIASRIEQEKMRLIREELTPGREAILLLDECQLGDNGIRARLLHRLYGNDEARNLDELETAMTIPSAVLLRLDSEILSR